MDDLIDSVMIGNKFGICIGKSGEIILVVGSYPLVINKLSLFDCSQDEFRKLGEMFLSYAKKLEKEKR